MESHLMEVTFFFVIIKISIFTRLTLSLLIFTYLTSTSCQPFYLSYNNNNNQGKACHGGYVVILPTSYLLTPWLFQ